MDHAPPVTIDRIRGAEAALMRSVDALSPAQWRGPSRLPGWTRGHVVVHLALNAEGLERALTGVHTGAPRTMYDSNRTRAADIEALDAGDDGAVRDRLLTAGEQLALTLESLSDSSRSATFDRTPGGQVIPVAAVPLLRLREVEVHHVDLDVGREPDDWDEGFRTILIESMIRRGTPEPFRMHAEDLGRTWEIGDPVGPESATVVGSSPDLGWWLTGRGEGVGLSSTSGDLPRIEPW